jgi:hypothetical protein
VKLEFLPQLDRKDRARDDPVELLPRSVDVGGAGPRDGKAILVEERLEVQIARSARRGVGRAGIESGVFGDDAAGAAVDFGRADVNVFLEPCGATEPIV